MAKYTKKDNVETFEVNPSLTPTLLTTFMKEKKRFIKNPYDASKEIEVVSKNGVYKNGLATSGYMFLERLEVDTETFIKFYASGLNALLDLTPQGLKVFKLIYKQILDKHDSDTIVLFFDDLVNRKLWDFSRSVFNNGLNNLLNKKIVFKSIIPYQYFINGNRIIQAREIILKQPDLLEQLGDDNNEDE
jgi:hypothetical protein